MWRWPSSSFAASRRDVVTGEETARSLARSPEEWQAAIPRLVDHLRAGGLLAYPTETTYGLGARVTPGGIEAIRELKGRGEVPFLALLPWGPLGLAGVRTLEPWGTSLVWTAAAEALANAVWPGPLTLVLEDRGGGWPAAARNPEGGVGVRVSPHAFVLDLVAALEEPLLSTSANLSGSPPAQAPNEVVEGLRHRPGWARCHLVDGGTLDPSPPSTVVDCTGRLPRLLREGAVSLQKLSSLTEIVHG
jgi:L-threonylcarbamoyladenylate synthase